MYRCANCDHKSETRFQYCPSCGVQQVGETDTAGLIGKTIKGKYRILEKLGSGSMGAVYLAEHVSLKKRVAIKVLHHDMYVSEESLQRFQREGIAAGQVNHPNAIQIFDFDRDPDANFFLAMEYVEGQSLKELLAERGALPPDEAVFLARQLLSTLAEAHRHGIVHRDLKPENLMVTRNAAGEVNLKVLDFGLSKLLDRPTDASLQTKTGHVMGTPMYMAPEQWNGEEADQRTDLYGTALILYEMLVGDQPFRGSNLTETFIKTTTQTPPSLAESRPDGVFPRNLEEVLQRGLAKSRDDRFQSAREMLEDLEALDLTQAGVAAPSRRQTSRTPSSATRRAPALWIGAAAMVVAALGVVIFGGEQVLGRSALVSAVPETERSEIQRSYVSLIEVARQDLRDGNAAVAMVNVGKAIAMPCVDAEAYLVRSAVYRAQGDVDTALADLRDAMDRRPRYAEASAAIGWIHFDSGAPDQADQRFRDAVGFDGDRSAAWAGIAAVLIDRDEHQEALQILDAAVIDYPRSALVHGYRGRVQLAMDSPDAAVQSLVQAKRLDPGLSWVYADLADAYLAKGDERAAEQQLRAALQTPAADSVRSRLAALLLGQESFDDAAEVLRPVLRANAPGDVHVMSGVVELNRGSRAKAIEALQIGLARGAAEPGRIHELLGGLMLEDERWAEAARHCLAAYVAGQSDAQLFTTWGVARFHLKQYVEAADNLEQAARMDESDLLSRYTLGVLYMDYLAQPDLARQHFQAYRRAGGDDPKVRDWLRRLGG
jgi:serine/threonine protein kinase/Tfp pilus assembly protein PilF